MSKNLSDIFPPTEIGGGGGGIEEAPLTGKMYARQSGAWSEFATGNLDDGNQDGEILTWDTAEANWTHDDTMIVKDGNVGIGGAPSAPSGLTGSLTKLELVGDGTRSGGLISSANGGKLEVMYRASTSEGLVGTTTAHNLSLVTDGTPRLTLDATGNATFSGTVNTSAEFTSGATWANDASPSMRLSGSNGLFTKNPAVNHLTCYNGGTATSNVVAEISKTGDATFSGTVNASAYTSSSSSQFGNLTVGLNSVYRNGQSGLFFGTSSGTNRVLYPTDGTGNLDPTVSLSLGTGTNPFASATFSGTVNAPKYVMNNAGFMTGLGSSDNQPYILPTDGSGNPANGSVSIGRPSSQGAGTPYIFKDAHFSGTVNASTTKAVPDSVYWKNSGDDIGLALTGAEIYTINASNTATKSGEVSLGDEQRKFKDAHFSGTVNAGDMRIGGNLIYNTSATGHGIRFNTVEDNILPVDNAGSLRTVGASLGNISRKFNNAHFAGTVNAAETYLRGDTGARTAWEKTGHYGWSAGIDNSSFFYINGGGATDALRIEPNSNVATFSGTVSAASFTDLNGDPIGGGGLPSGDWHCTGSITAEGNVTAYALSDERLKDDIAPMPLGLIDGINPVTFKWKDSGKASGGVIAQQLQACGLDDWVNVAPNGDLGVDYNALVGVLLAEVLELKARVKEMESANTHS